MIRISIRLTGSTTEEAVNALEVVKRQLEEGFTSGKQNTMESSFHYEVEGEEEPPPPEED